MSQVVARRVAHVMGMPISLALRGRHADTRSGEDAWAQVVAELEDVDRVFSPFRPDSIVSRLDRGEDIEVPQEVVEVLGLGERIRRESDGAFDVRRGGRLDPSGVVKGWAADRAAKPLRHLEDTDFCLSAGGDLVALVVDPDRPAWQIGIEHPLRTDEIAATVPVRDGGVATSGPAHRGAHITDARTGLTPTALASVTVVAADLVTADLDATAAFALGVEGPAWLRRRGRHGLLVDRSGRASAL